MKVAKVVLIGILSLSLIFLPLFYGKRGKVYAVESKAAAAAKVGEKEGKKKRGLLLWILLGGAAIGGIIAAFAGAAGGDGAGAPVHHAVSGHSSGM